MNKEKKAEMVLTNLVIRIDNCKNITDLEKLIKMFCNIYEMIGDNNED